MRSTNHIFLVGTIGGDPKTKVTSGGAHEATFSMVTSESWKDKATGEWKEDKTWHQIRGHSRQADYIERECRKGRYAIVTGKQRHTDWAKPDGTHSYFSFVEVDEIMIVDRPQRERNEPPASAPQTSGDDDIPF